MLAARVATPPSAAFDGSLPSPGTIAAAAGTSLGLTLAGTAATLAVGLPATIAIYRRSWRGSRAVTSLLTAPFVLPTIVVALAMLLLARDAAPFLSSGSGTTGIVAALALFNIAVVVRFVGPRLATLDPQQVHAARTLGATPWQTSRRIVWPFIRRSVLSAAAVTAVFCASSFSLVLIIGRGNVITLETAAYAEVTTFLNVRAAALYALAHTLLVAGFMVVAWVSQRGDEATTGSRSGAPLTAGPRAATAFALVPALILVAGPILALIGRSFARTDGKVGGAYLAIAEAPQAGIPSLGAAALRSIGLGAVAAVLTLLLALCVLAAGHIWTTMRWVRVAALSPLVLSPVAIGTGLLLSWSSALRATGGAGALLMLVTAQALVGLPLVVRIAGGAFDAIDPRQIAAARVLGAHGWSLAANLIAPAMRGAIGASIGMAFAVAVGEFGAALFLARPDEPTLTTAISRLLSRPGVDSFTYASAAAVLLAIIAGGTMALAERVADHRHHNVRRLSS